jgi:hypothetical protein
MNDKVKPRKLPPIRWVMPPKPDKSNPSPPPPDPADFQGGIYVTIDENKFYEFLKECENGTEKNS